MFCQGYLLLKADIKFDTIQSNAEQIFICKMRSYLVQDLYLGNMSKCYLIPDLPKSGQYS